MSNRFYTNVTRNKSKILHRGYEDGVAFSEEIKYQPYLFLKSNKANSKYKTLYGTNVEKIEFDDFWDQKRWLDQHRDIDGFSFHGCMNGITTFIYDSYPGEMKFDPKLVKTAIVDIECDGLINGDDFIDIAPAAIVSIAMLVGNDRIAFGMKDFDVPKGVKYYKCLDELSLLKTFLTIWEGYNVDVISGWNIEGFDIPYLVNRIARLMDMDEAARLSPWKYLIPKTMHDKFGREKRTYDIPGIAVIDYQELYKKFTIQVQGQLESYSLNFVAYHELKEEKIDYSEFGTLKQLYEENFQKFIEYNIHDCELIRRIDDKLLFFNLLYEIAYIAKCNYQDVLKTLPVWESLIHAYLMDRRIVVPIKKRNQIHSKIPGGFVKEPIPALYKWVVSFDVASLYPHLIMQYNLSPETLKSKIPLPDVDKLIQGAKFDHGGLSVAATGCCYSRDKAGFLAVLMREIFDRRNIFKKEMLKAQAQYEETPTDEISRSVASLKAKQQAYKILANSGYGALANQYFTFFSYDLAMSVTLSGQLTIKWVAKALNDYMNRLMGTENKDYIIAVDTDSNYLNCGPLVEKLFANETDKSKIIKFLDLFAEEKCQKIIDDAFNRLAKKMNVFDPCLSMKREAIAETALWTGKKRYAMNVWDNEGVRFDKPKMKITGLETKRSSVPEICRKALSDCLDIIMMQSEDELIAFVDAFKEKFFASSFYDIASPRGLNGLDKYHDPVSRWKSKCPFHVKGAIVFNEWVKDHKLEDKYAPISNGEKIKFIYLKTPNRLRSDVISCSAKVPDELNLHPLIDYKTQYEKTFLSPLKAIVSVAKWDIDRENTLDGAW